MASDVSNLLILYKCTTSAGKPFLLIHINRSRRVVSNFCVSNCGTMTALSSCCANGHDHNARVFLVFKAFTARALMVWSGRIRDRVCRSSARLDGGSEDLYKEIGVMLKDSIAFDLV